MEHHSALFECAQTKISLVEKGKLLSNEKKVAETFSSFFENTANKQGVNNNDVKFNDELVLSTNSTDIAIQKFSNYFSVNLEIILLFLICLNLEVFF